MGRLCVCGCVWVCDLPFQGFWKRPRGCPGFVLSTAAMGLLLPKMEKQNSTSTSQGWVLWGCESV